MEIITADNFDLNNYKGKWVILFFYPKDNTPGCTLEACNFRNFLEEIKLDNVVIIGVSSDSVESHNKFQENFNLNYILVSDEKRQLIKKFGCLKERKIFGKTIITTSRDTFLIDPNGEIVKEYRRVSPINHIQNIHNDLKALNVI